jgi:hypothetical protein
MPESSVTVGISAAHASATDPSGSPLPIGAYEPRWFMRDQHMNPAESVQAFIDCGAEFGLGHHYGTFQLTDEPIDAPLIALADALKDADISTERFRKLLPGEVWLLYSRGRVDCGGRHGCPRLLRIYGHHLAVRQYCVSDLSGCWPQPAHAGDAALIWALKVEPDVFRKPTTPRHGPKVSPYDCVTRSLRSSETVGRNPASVANFRTPRPALMCECRHFATF